MDLPHVLLTLSAQMNILPLQTMMTVHLERIEVVNVEQDTIEVLLLLVEVTVFPQGINALLHNPVFTCL